MNTTDTISWFSHYLISVQKGMTWSMILFLLFGNIGNVCNCFVFLQKSLRTNSCSCYMFIASIANIVALTVSVPTSIYAVERTDPSTYSLIYCKLRLYIYHTQLMISRYLIIFACIDRACLSSRRVGIRSFSNIRKAQMISIGTTIFWFLAAVHIPIILTIQNGSCAPQGVYKLVFGIYILIFAGLIPPISMSIFSLITVRNLHSAHFRFHSKTTSSNRLMRQRDFHLTRMLISQVVVYVLTTTPYPFNAFYSSITMWQNKSLNRQIIESFIYFVTSTFLLFINPAAAFYIYLTTSKAFRSEFFGACVRLCPKFLLKKQMLSATSTTNPGFLSRTLKKRRDAFHSSSV